MPKKIPISEIIAPPPLSSFPSCVSEPDYQGVDPRPPRTSPAPPRTEGTRQNIKIQFKF